MYNKVIVLGRLTKDPEVKVTSGGVNVVVGRIASNGGKEVCYLPLVAFGKTGEVLSSYVKKGDLVFIEGRMRTTQMFTQLVVEKVKLMPRAKPTDATATDMVTDTPETDEAENIEDVISNIEPF